METNISKEIEKAEMELERIKKIERGIQSEPLSDYFIEIVARLETLTQAKQMIKTAIDEFDILQCFDVYNVVANWKDELKAKIGVEA
jgi:hypothetical protein